MVTSFILSITLNFIILNICLSHSKHVLMAFNFIVQCSLLMTLSWKVVHRVHVQLSLQKMVIMVHFCSFFAFHSLFIFFLYNSDSSILLQACFQLHLLLCLLKTLLIGSSSLRNFVMVWSTKDRFSTYHIGIVNWCLLYCVQRASSYFLDISFTN